MSDPNEALGLELDANLVLAAGAGSGKTHALVTVALALYVGAGPSARAAIEPGRVWVVTFTEKAARELRQRIVSRVRRLATGGYAGDSELAALLGERSVPPEHWASVLDQLPGAPIGTFHGLSAQILRSFALEAGVDPGFAVLDETDAGELFERVLDDVLIRELETGGSDSHTRAAARALGSAELLRGALRRLHAKLGEEGRDPASLLRDATGPRPGFDAGASQRELELASRTLARALAMLERCREDRLGATLRALATERQRIGECEPDRIADWYPALVRVVGQRRGGGSLPKPARQVWEPVFAAWQQVEDAVAAQAEQRLAGRIVELLDAVSAAYHVEKQRAGVLDFVDLVRRAHDLLRDDRVVRRQVKQRVGALLVDEFQDTNGLQFDLVHLLAEDRSRELAVPRGVRTSEVLPLADRTLAGVGDRKQSIYEFRGADVVVFQALAASGRAGQGGLRLHALRRNWRSRPNLVEFSNRLFARLMSGDAGAFAVDWVDAEDRLTAVREDSAQLEHIPVVQLLVGDPTAELATQLIEAPTRLAEHLATLLAAGPPLGRTRSGEPRALRGSDIAILFQSHTPVGRYRRALDELGIASVVVGGRGFHAAREVRELAALVLAIADPRGEMASAAIWRSPVWGIDDSSLVKLAAGRALSVWTHRDGCAVDLPADQAARVTEIAGFLVRLHHELDRLGPARTLRFAVDRLGLRAVLAGDPTGEQRIANVDKLLDRLDAAGGVGLGSRAIARRLLERGSDPRDREPPAEVAAAADPDAVRIMTVHAAKGLEFPVVVVPELGAEPRGQAGPVTFDRELGLAVVSPDMLGRRRSSAHTREVAERLELRRDAESRRLFYVAVTRARELLILSGESPDADARANCRPGRGPDLNCETNWRKMLELALPDLEQFVERVEFGSGSQPAASTGMPWLLERVAEVRAQAIGQASALADSTGGGIELQPERSADSAVEPTDDAETGDALDRALARSAPIDPIDCELDISLTAFAEFAASAAGYRARGIGVGPTSATELARDRGRFVHRLLGRIDLGGLARDAAAELESCATRERVPAEIWAAIRPELVAVAERPWFAEVLAIHALEPRRVLRSLPFALVVEADAQDVSPPEPARTLASLFPAEPVSSRPARGRVIVRGRIDMIWIDASGRLNLIDWQSSESADPAHRDEFRRFVQATALRRIWGPGVAIAHSPVLLRSSTPDPLWVEFEPRDATLERTAARLLHCEFATHALTTNDHPGMVPFVDHLRSTDGHGDA